MSKTKSKCKRCGKCCVDLMLPYSPKELKQNYEDWYSNKKGVTPKTDIFLVYPMLVYKFKKGKKYHYTCKHFKYDENKLDLGYCAIHDNRPKMCSGFPFYDREQLYMHDMIKPSQYEGCGYNK